MCYPASRVWDTWWTEWHGTGFSPGTSVICCQYISTSAPHALQFSAVRMSPHALSFLLSECLHTHLVFCCQYVFTRTSVFCCQYVSTIALHALFFYCQYVSTSSPHALQFSAVIMSPLAFQFSAASMSPPMPKGGNSLSLTLHIQVTLAVDSIVK